MSEASIEQGFRVADSEMGKIPGKPSLKPSDAKAERLADALRVNLKRRKNQVRERTDQEASLDKDSDSKLA
ncbi:MAG: hypothetical protein CMM46_10825 [Rhodospirillaceae bacterium]|nr:hypothetical protein [Rhodospirillaceae bacterium]|tara:strand:- start:730 stop:942 length:213 start_codon:yes stop_codon:yes gene_type:complete